MSKRLRFLISSLVLSVGFIIIQFLEGSLKFPAIGILVPLTGALSVWSFFEGLGKNMTWISLILPMMFTLSVGIFWFLLPASIYTRIPIVIFYSLGIYVLSTTMNIYTVSSLRTIALLRAARGVGFVLTLVTSFLIFDAILSIRQNILITISLVLVSSFLLFLQGFWSINLEKEFDKDVFQMATISSLIMAELSTLIYFWPVTVVVGSLFLTSGGYLLLGLGQAKLEERLFSATIKEYLTVGLIVLIGMFFATRWGG
ncbi:MAG: hypothetical protein UR20_C0052G0003 [Candidatus Woesebacteria bacterium GW2011_GWE2_31_6]|nr:MAG: hypothetical protein UR20_C0052G0003 [Candidatus Woesebacteria bacterium GW2011_GWE2_31_6]